MNAVQSLKLPHLPVALRLAGEEDLEPVVTLLGHLGYAWSRSELHDLYGRFLEDPAMTVLLAVHAGNAVVGLMTLRVTTVLRLNGSQVSVEELVVHRDYRGRGVGSRLMHFARQFTMKKQAVRLEVVTSHTRESFRRGFFQKHGLHHAANTTYRLHF